MSATDTSSKTETGEILVLDLLRGLAAFAVMLSHVRATSWVEYALLPANQHNPATAAFFLATRLGLEAVMIFFILSGLFVGGRVLEKVEAGRFNVRDYAIDRATRILLPLIPACILTEIANQLTGGSFRPATFFGAMAGLNAVLTPPADNPVLWSLAYEIWFYVLAGALGFIAATKRATLPAVLLISLCVMVFCKLSALYLVFWLLGAAAVRFMRLTRPWAALALGLVAMVAGIGLAQAGSGTRAVVMAVTLPPKEVGLGLLCVGLCLCLPALHLPVFNRWLRLFRKPILLFSGMSYTLYLVHFPVMVLINQHMPTAPALDAPSFGLFFLRLAICIAAAWLFWLAFERNTPKLRAFLRRWFAPRA